MRPGSGWVAFGRHCRRWHEGLRGGIRFPQLQLRGDHRRADGRHVDPSLSERAEDGSDPLSQDHPTPGAGVDGTTPALHRSLK